MNGIGERIRQYRMARGLSQEDFAAQMGVSRQSVSKWENDMAQPELDRLLKMCEIFAISLDALVRGEIAENEDTVTAGADEVPAPVETVETSVIPHARRIWGIALCCAGAAVLLILTLLGGFLPGLAAAAILVLPGIYCLTVHRHLGLWIGWTYFGIMDYFLLAATSGSRGLVISAIRNPEIFSFANPISLVISTGINLFLGIMVICTLVEFRHLTLPGNRKEWLMTGAAFGGWLAAKIIVYAVNYALMVLVNLPSLSYYLLFPLLGYCGIFLITVFLIRILAQVRSYKKR